MSDADAVFIPPITWALAITILFGILVIKPPEVKKDPSYKLDTPYYDDDIVYSCLEETDLTPDTWIYIPKEIFGFTFIKLLIANPLIVKDTKAEVFGISI